MDMYCVFTNVKTKYSNIYMNFGLVRLRQSLVSLCNTYLKIHTSSPGNFFVTCNTKWWFGAILNFAAGLVKTIYESLASGMCFYKIM